jgi:putative toxin-antitoxin system antitoxin component (TIGR02293 family)
MAHSTGHRAKARPEANKGRQARVYSFVHATTASVADDALTVAAQVKAVEAGLPETELTQLQASLALPTERLVPLLGLSKATFHRRKKAAGARLSPLVSDRVARFALLLRQAIRVFGNRDDANRWLKAAQVGLGGAVPLDYAKTEIGAREVERLLGRIEHGVYA